MKRLLLITGVLMICVLMTGSMLLAPDRVSSTRSAQFGQDTLPTLKPLDTDRDTRAVLDITGRVKEISVSPDGKIWLVTAMGNAYYADSIDAPWEQHPQFAVSREDMDVRVGILERISFFNTDTAIMSGFLSGLFRTTDACRTWQLIKYDDDMWVYDAFIDHSGKAWMGGSSGDLLYSDDQGRTWRKLNSPYDGDSRLRSIYMLNDEVGVIGALENNIDMTSDNWKTHRKIRTPLDQKKYTRPREYSDDRIEKVFLWKDFIVVNQDGHIYYSEQATIVWKTFPVQVVDFELDRSAQELFAVTDDHSVISFTTPSAYRSLCGQKLPETPIDITIVGHALYAVLPGYRVAKVDASGVTCIIPYTVGHQIPEPDIVRRSGSLTWGATGDQIYLHEEGEPWYREASLAFQVADLKLLDDSTGILWDGVGSNYRYTLRDHVPSPYVPPEPLAGFLSSPITSLTIDAGSRGCAGGVESRVDYRRTTQHSLACTAYTVHGFEDDIPRAFVHAIEGDQLAAILTTMSNNPAAMPTLPELAITEQDVEAYNALVHERKSIKGEDLFHPRKMEMEFYLAIPRMLDTLDKSTIEHVLQQREKWSSTTSNWFSMVLSNANGDTLRISRQYYVVAQPWSLPWQVHFNGGHFNSCSIELSRFVASAVPDDFHGNEVFSNARMIMAIADYLYDRNQPD